MSVSQAFHGRVCEECVELLQIEFLFAKERVEFLLERLVERLGPILGRARPRGL